MTASAAAQSSLPDGGRFTALDSWRGIAALGIAVRHINGNGPLLSGPVHDNLSMAVDFFFVLSGFVIAGSYGDRLAAGFSTLRFMILRYGRVWPLQAMLVLVYLGLELGYALMGGDALPGRAPFSEAREPLHLVPALLLAEAYLFPGADGWVAPSWSISVEIGLYLLAALLWRYARGAGTWLLAGLALIALVMLDTDNSGAWFYVLRGVAGFGLGACGWRLWCSGAVTAVPAWLLSALELAALPAVLLAIGLRAPYFVADPLFLAVVLVFAREAGPVSRLLRTAPFVLLGSLSYSLYMVHGLLYGRIIDGLEFVQTGLGRQWVAASVGGIDYILLPALPATLMALAMLAGAVGCAWLAWRFVEWPAREWSRRYARRIGAAKEEAQAPAL